jgi:hypothetical protein
MPRPKIYITPEQIEEVKKRRLDDLKERQKRRLHDQKILKTIEWLKTDKMAYDLIHESIIKSFFTDNNITDEQ